MSLLQRADLDTSQINEKIEQLVDQFRANRAREVSLGDVAAVTEVLISTMERYFGSIDTAICREFRDIIQHIGEARREIAQLRPNELKGERKRDASWRRSFNRPKRPPAPSWTPRKKSWAPTCRRPRGRTR